MAKKPSSYEDQYYDSMKSSVKSLQKVQNDTFKEESKKLKDTYKEELKKKDEYMKEQLANPDNANDQEYIKKVYAQAKQSKKDEYKQAKKELRQSKKRLKETNKTLLTTANSKKKEGTDYLLIKDENGDTKLISGKLNVAMYKRKNGIADNSLAGTFANSLFGVKDSALSTLKQSGLGALAALKSQLPAIPGLPSSASGFKNAFSNYENKIQESKGKFNVKSLKDKLSGAVSSMTGVDVTSLNKLTAGGALKGLAKNLLNKVAGMASSFASNAIKQIGNMASDMVNKAINAGISYISNLAEDFINNVKKAVFFPDSVVLVTLKGLYEAGADLAYHEHTIRLLAIQRDLVETLKWVDEQYRDKGQNIKYKLDYTKLQGELALAANNSCWKVLKYMFKSLYEEREEYIKLRNSEQTYINSNFATQDMIDLAPDTYGKKTTLVKKYNESVNRIENLMVSYFKSLVVNSHTYLNVSAVKEFFDTFPDVIIPKYYGLTDDKYNKQYLFNTSNMDRMMPFISSFDTTASDKATSTMNYLQTQTGDTGGLNKTSDAINLNVKSLIQGGKNTISQYQENINNVYASKGLSLVNTALNKGSSATGEELNEAYTWINSDGVKVIKRANVIRDGINTFLNEPKYINLKNKNMKAIYVYMSSDVIFAENKMVNETFLNRCKEESADVLSTNLSKAKGILGSTKAVQSVFDISDAIECTGYKFVAQNSKYIFDPKVNLPIDQFKENYSDITELGDSTIDELNRYIEEVKNNVVSNSDKDYSYFEDGSTEESSSPGFDKPDTNVINSNITKLENEIINDPVLKSKLESVFRFIDEIPIYIQRDIAIKYLACFYEYMVKTDIPSEYIEDVSGKLVKYLTGRGGEKDFNNFVSTVDNLQPSYYTTCLRILISLYYLNNLKKELDLNNNYEVVITKLFRVTFSLASREIYTNGFASSVYKYDIDFLQSLTKRTYVTSIESLKNAANSNSKLNSILLQKLDTMSDIFTGYNRSGIFGWNYSDKRLKYTDFNNGDYHDVKATKNGVFISGDNITNEIGIIKYNYPGDSFVRTNIKNGVYDIYDYKKGTFFVDISNGNVYKYNEKTTYIDLKLTIGIKDDFVLKELPNEMIILYSKSNNGIYYWSDEHQQFLGLDTTGGNFVYHKCDIGFVIFSKANPSSGVYLCDNKTVVKVPSMTSAMTSFVEYQGSATVSGNYQPPQSGEQGGSGGGGGSTTITKTIYVYNLIFGTANGITRAVIKSESTNFDIKNVETIDTNNQFVNESVFLIPKSDSYCHIIRKRLSDDIIEQNSFVTFYGSTSIGSISSPSISGTSYLSNSSIKNIFNGGTTIKNSIHPQFEGYQKGYYTDVGVFYLFDNVWYYSKTNAEYPINVQDASSDVLLNMEFRYIEELNSVYITSSNEIFYFNENIRVKSNGYDTNVIDLVYVLSESDKTVKWDFNIMTRRDNENVVSYVLYFSNIEKGVRFFSTSTYKAITCGLNSGNWRVYYAKDRYIATSCEGSNEGLRFTKTLSNTPLFTNIEPMQVTQGSYKFADWDYVTKRLYIITNRYNTKWDVSKIVYDIDELIYTLGYYDMYKIITDYNTSSIDDLLTFVGKLIEDGLLYINDDILNSLIDDGGSSSGSNVTTPEGMLSLNDLISILGSELDLIDKYISDAIASSGLFAEIFTRAETALTFDPNDPKAVDNVLSALMMLYSLDDENNIEFSDIMARYRASLRKLLILNNTSNIDGSVITEEVGSHEWNAKYDNASDDFLDSYETTENYRYKEKETPILYKTIINDGELNSDYMYCKRYGIKLFYTLNNTKYVTDYDTEDKIYETEGKYRELSVREIDYNIINNYE